MNLIFNEFYILFIFNGKPSASDNLRNQKVSGILDKKGGGIL